MHDLILILAFFIGDILGTIVGFVLMMFFMYVGLPFLRDLWKGITTWTRQD